MRAKIRLVQFGMGMREGTIVSWLRQPGDRIVEGEPLCEVDTDKATQEMESPLSGTLVEIVAAEGTTVPVRDVIAVVEVEAL